MKTINAPFAVDAKIDQKKLTGFAFTNPYYLGWAYELDMSEYLKDSLNRLDFFEFHYRRYLLGWHKTLHRVLHEVRSFNNCSPEAAQDLINYSLSNIKATILKEEWFELMPKLEKSTAKILPLLTGQSSETTTRLVDIISNQYPGHELMWEYRNPYRP